MVALRVWVGVFAVLVLASLAGCGGVFGTTDAPNTPSLTPAPVPNVTETADSSTVTPPSPTETLTDRYGRLEPTCTRPPGLVVHIQVEALANNNPETDNGIRTVWRFAAPSNRRFTGPYSNFAELITSSYTPLLEAERLAYGPLNRTGDRATRTVSVGSENSTTTYVWVLEKQSEGRYDGCWMTVGVSEVTDGPVRVAQTGASERQSSPTDTSPSKATATRGQD